jgi:hypothetical protein
MAKLHISAEAAEYIRQFLFGSDGTDLVVALVPELVDERGGVATLGPEASLDAQIEAARARFERLPERVWVNWIVGAAERGRFPLADIHTFDGVDVYWPIDTSDAIGDRSLVMKGGQLSFDPPTSAFQVDKTPRPWDV